MQILWCWRCRQEIPMLDEEEYKIAAELYVKGMKSKEPNYETRYQELLQFYYKTTSCIETVPNALMHHRIALYGPPCEKCGKPYRTPKASFCAACGNKRPKAQ